MALVRCLTEIGMGVDVHGRDYTSAAKRAVYDALHHASLGFQRLLGPEAGEMLIDITIGVPKPEAVDCGVVAAALPHGKGTVRAVPGGLEVPSEDGSDALIIVNAAVIISLDDGR
tara:strand:- start:487 stop:831 length:345 start_codon:yes stop_codon:yes gene_type:complete